MTPAQPVPSAKAPWTRTTVTGPLAEFVSVMVIPFSGLAGLSLAGQAWAKGEVKIARRFGGQKIRNNVARGSGAPEISAHAQGNDR
jgi:hypothetical protein